MKRAILFVLIALAVISCKKNNLDPEGPTDVRIYNNTDQVFENVQVKTTNNTAYTNVEHNYGTVNPGTYSEYYRVDIAYPKADVTLTIGGTVYSVPAVDYTYLHYLSTMKIAYWITIVNQANHVLGIQVVPEAEIDDL